MWHEGGAWNIGLGNCGFKISQLVLIFILSGPQCAQMYHGVVWVSRSDRAR